MLSILVPIILFPIIPKQNKKGENYLFWTHTSEGEKIFIILALISIIRIKGKGKKI